ncbi:hypothetical protein [Mycobacteroides chelonae]|uniref:hypothetical protein n=1 Tax=Mycobacteroides chelonae TaxID=1774 RepID=UPI003AAB52E6
MTGMLLTLPNLYLLLYRESDAPRYQEHQIAHELAHLLFEHEGVAVLAIDRSKRCSVTSSPIPMLCVKP